MKNKGLTLTIIFEASSLNYDNRIGNELTLKKIIKADGKQYAYLSRQALRYSIVETMGINKTPTTNEWYAVQFDNAATIKDYPEIDLFGYLKTERNKAAQTRSAAVRLSNAEALNPFKRRKDFMNNSELSKRCEAKKSINMIEMDTSFYVYTVTIDLCRIGEDFGISLPKKEKIKRVNELLNAIQFLHRDIRGRRESLNPIFVIGGVYDICNPFFLNNIKMVNNNLNCELIKKIILSSEHTKKNTRIGCVAERFGNMDDLNDLTKDNIEDVFERLRDEVKEYYESNFD